MEKQDYIRQSKQSLVRTYKTIDVGAYIITGITTGITIGYNAPVYISDILMAIIFIPVILKIIASKSYWDSILRNKENKNYSRVFDLGSKVVNWILVLLFFVTAILWLLRGFPSYVKDTNLIKLLNSKIVVEIDFYVLYFLATISNFFVCVI